MLKALHNLWVSIYEIEMNFQGYLSMSFFSQHINLYQLIATTVSKNSSPNKCKKYSCGLESLLTQSTGPGVLLGEKSIAVETISQV